MSLRVFVNEKPVTVARGATVRDAVEALDRDLAGLLASGAAYATDGVGRPVDAGEVIGEGGAILRVVVTARKGGGAARMSKELLRRWPKAELHVHLDGCLRPETMLELAREQGVRLPADTPAGLAQALHVKHAKSLEEYLTKYEITLSVMQTARAPSAGIRRGSIALRSSTPLATAWPAPATPGKGTGRPQYTRRCTPAAPSASVMARGWARIRRCSTTWSSAPSRSRCVSAATSTPTP